MLLGRCLAGGLVARLRLRLLTGCPVDLLVGMAGQREDVLADFDSCRHPCSKGSRHSSPG